MKEKCTDKTESKRQNQKGLTIDKISLLQIALKISSANERGLFQMYSVSLLYLSMQWQYVQK